jgi:hypothetical protein
MGKDLPRLSVETGNYGVGICFCRDLLYRVQVPRTLEDRLWKLPKGILPSFDGESYQRLRMTYFQRMEQEAV